MYLKVVYYLTVVIKCCLLYTTIVCSSQITIIAITTLYVENFVLQCHVRDYSLVLQMTVLYCVYNWDAVYN